VQAPKLFLDLCCKKQDPPHCNSPPPLTHKNKNTLLLNRQQKSQQLLAVFLWQASSSSSSSVPYLEMPICTIPRQLLHHFGAIFILHPEFCNVVCPQVLVRPTLMVYYRTRGILHEGISWIFTAENREIILHEEISRIYCSNRERFWHEES